MSSIPSSSSQLTNHRAQASETWAEAKSSFRTIGYSWQAVAKGQAVMGGGNPSDRVARAEGAWNKTRTAVSQHGGNAVMAAVLSVSGLVTGTWQTVAAAGHGVAGLFQKQDDSGAAQAARGVENLRS